MTELKEIAVLLRRILSKPFTSQVGVIVGTVFALVMVAGMLHGAFGWMVFGLIGLVLVGVVMLGKDEG